MTVRYLIDTDWVIHYLNGREDIGRRLDELQREGLGLSVISLAELYEGIHYSTDPEGNEQDLNDFLQGMTILCIDKGGANLREASMNSDVYSLTGDTA